MTTFPLVSQEKLKSSFRDWDVDFDYADPMINYLLWGFSPGSFFTAVLANDFTGAMARSHPANSVPALKNLVLWMVNCLPRETWGDYDKVLRWSHDVTVEHRRQVLEQAGLIFTVKEEICEILQAD